MSDSCKELLLSSLTSFYNKNDDYKYLLKSIIEGKHQLSLRMIDWLVTIYSKNNNIIYWISNDTNDIYNCLPEDAESLTMKNKYKKNFNNNYSRYEDYDLIKGEKLPCFVSIRETDIKVYGRKLGWVNRATEGLFNLRRLFCYYPPKYFF